MRFQLIGVNHKSAPLEVRERLAIPEARLPDTCRDLTAYPGIEEGMVISTCNRVEIVAHTANGHADLRGFLHDHFHLTADELDPHLYEFREKDAVRHLFRVASSLDSMVVGEAQILGQVKEAYATARAVGAVRGQLDQLFSRAFAVAKRVRTETAVGSSSVSIASVAVELAKKIFGTLEGKKVFIVGAGKMSELAARHLMAHGCASIFVANRTYDRAIGLAQKFNGQAIRFEDLYATCDRADIVITSTGAPHAIFRREHGEQFLSRRKNRPMFFIDIAVPRDVSPEMAKLDGIFTYDIDDLQQAVTSHVADRRKEAELAEAIITGEVERFEARLHTLDVVPTIVSLQDHLETIRQAEIDRVRGRMGQLTPEQEIAIEALTRGIINKVMHTPITTLKTAAKESEATTVVDVVRRLFNLQDKESRVSGEEKRSGDAPVTSRVSRSEWRVDLSPAFHSPWLLSVEGPRRVQGCCRPAPSSTRLAYSIQPSGSEPACWADHQPIRPTRWAFVAPQRSASCDLVIVYWDVSLFRKSAYEMSLAHGHVWRYEFERLFSPISPISSATGRQNPDAATCNVPVSEFRRVDNAGHSLDANLQFPTPDTRHQRPNNERNHA